MDTTQTHYGGKVNGGVPGINGESWRCSGHQTDLFCVLANQNLLVENFRERLSALCTGNYARKTTPCSKKTKPLNFGRNFVKS